MGTLGGMLAVGVTMFTIFAGCAAMETRPISPDARQRVVLPAVDRDRVLAEMRLMLESVSRIVQALAASDRAGVEAAARSSGAAAAVDVDPALMSRLPEAFRRLGMQTHHAFDRLAEEVRGGAAQDVILRGLGQVTANCVACHASYRLDEAR